MDGPRVAFAVTDEGRAIGSCSGTSPGISSRGSRSARGRPVSRPMRPAGISPWPSAAPGRSGRRATATRRARPASSTARNGSWRARPPPSCRARRRRCHARVLARPLRGQPGQCVRNGPLDGRVSATAAGAGAVDVSADENRVATLHDDGTLTVVSREGTVAPRLRVGPAGPEPPGASRRRARRATDRRVRREDGRSTPKLEGSRRRDHGRPAFRDRARRRRPRRVLVRRRVQPQRASAPAAGPVSAGSGPRGTVQFNVGAHGHLRFLDEPHRVSDEMSGPPELLTVAASGAGGDRRSAVSLTRRHWRRSRCRRSVRPPHTSYSTAAWPSHARTASAGSTGRAAPGGRYSRQSGDGSRRARIRALLLPCPLGARRGPETVREPCGRRGWRSSVFSTGSSATSPRTPEGVVTTVALGGALLRRTSPIVYARESTRPARVGRSAGRCPRCSRIQSGPERPRRPVARGNGIAMLLPEAIISRRSRTRRRVLVDALEGLALHGPQRASWDEVSAGG